MNFSFNRIQPVTADNLPQLMPLVVSQATYHNVPLTVTQLTDKLEAFQEYLGLAEDNPSLPVARGFFIYAQEQEAPVGYIVHSRLMTPKGLRSYMEDFHVLPDCRGGGFGKILMMALAHFAHESESAGSLDWVVAANNPAVDFYERIGGRRLGPRHTFPTEAIYRHARPDPEESRYAARELGEEDLPSVARALMQHCPEKAGAILENLQRVVRDPRDLEMVAIDRTNGEVVALSTSSANLSTFRVVVGLEQSSFRLLTEDSTEGNLQAIWRSMHRGTCRALKERAWVGHLNRMPVPDHPQWEGELVREFGGGPLTMIDEEPESLLLHYRLDGRLMREMAERWSALTSANPAATSSVRQRQIAGTPLLDQEPNKSSQTRMSPGFECERN